jgi:predicted DNA-binding transcriptional regulator YafY
MNHGSLRRIYELDRMLRLGRFISADKAAEQFEVSTRTIERDLEELRHDLGAEIVYDREKRHYKYAGNPITLPAQWLTEREIAILLIAERVLRVFTDTSFHAEIHPTFNKLLDPIRHDKKTIAYIKDLCNSVYFYRPVLPIKDMQLEFSIMLEAIMLHQRVSMSYQTGGRDAGERRELDPYVLVNNGGEWYVVGQCRRSKTIKTFTLSQIIDPKPLDHFFDIPTDFKIERHLEQGFGRMHGDQPQEVSLRITPPAAGWIGRSKWHASQKITRDKDGSITLTMQCPITDNLVRWILQMAECVRVEKPKVLREMLLEKVKALAGNNK